MPGTNQTSNAGDESAAESTDAVERRSLREICQECYPRALRTGSWVFPLLAIFLVVRLFSGYEVFLLDQDQCKYLTLGRNLPFHTLYDFSLYLIHPPLYGWTIGLVGLVLPILDAGLFVSIAFAAAYFFAVLWFARLAGLRPLGITLALLFIGLNATAATFDSHVSRISIFQFLAIMSMATFYWHLRNERPGIPLAATIFTGICLWTTDQALALLPCQALLWWSVGLRKKDLWPLFRHWSLVGLAYGAWLAVRLTVFLRHEYYPAGIDGTIEPVGDFTLKALMQPNFFPETNAHRALFTPVDFSLEQLNVFNLFTLPADVVYLTWIQGVWLSILVVVCAVICALVRRQRLPIALLGMSCLLYWPNFFGMNPWYGLGFLGPFALLCGYALTGGGALEGLIARAGQGDSPLRGRVRTWGPRGACIALWIIAIIQVAHWLQPPERQLRERGLGLAPGPHFLFARPPSSSPDDFALTLPGSPQTGFMAPVGLVPELVYLTKRRILALPFAPDQAARHIDAYNIEYIVFTGEYLSSFDSEHLDFYTARTAARAITQDPSRFEPVGEYQAPRAGGGQHHYHVYRVVR